jgi:hypothetical protein
LRSELHLSSLQNCGRRFRKECRRSNGSSRAKSRDPDEVTLKLSRRDPSTSLGMTELRELLKLQPPAFAFFETRY